MEVRAAPHLAGVSDRGRHHPRNEDYLALAAGAVAEVLVVCDGVSNSHDPAGASEAAALAACAALRAGLRPGILPAETDMAAAVEAARRAVLALPCPPGAAQDPPETTLVAAVRRGRRLVLGWVGDSRAYLLGAGARLLTRDHSWVNEVVSAGLMTPAEAARAPQAHCITRSLGGRPGADNDAPSLAALDLPEGPACLLLCSDGLWNCAAEPHRLADLVRRAPAPDALDVARILVDFALDAGGKDNITAAVMTLG
jgi:serine/threonine protein phosphatase PrpC